MTQSYVFVEIQLKEVDSEQSELKTWRLRNWRVGIWADKLDGIWKLRYVGRESVDVDGYQHPGAGRVLKMAFLIAITRGHLVEQSSGGSTHSSMICGTSGTKTWRHQGDHCLVSGGGGGGHYIGRIFACTDFFILILETIHFGLKIVKKNAQLQRPTLFTFSLTSSSLLAFQYENEMFKVRYLAQKKSAWEILTYKKNLDNRFSFRTGSPSPVFG